MGTLYFSQTNNNLDNNEFQSKFQLNNNLDETNRKKENQSESKKIQRRKCQCGLVLLIAFGLTFITLGLLSIKITLTDIVLTKRLEMRGPLYDLWLNPEPELRLNVYIFTVENANEFLNGTDSKIKLKEIGPVVYREYLQHRDVVFHENSTLSYTAFRWAEFVPHANRPGILNETITVPNLAILAAAGFVNEQNFFLQLGYNYLHRNANEGVFINITIYDYLWNYRSGLLKKAQNYAASMVPTLNTGILHGIYDKPADRYNVRIGKKYGDSQFFLINTVNGAPTVPGYDVKKGDCYASVENSTEGAMYRQRITKASVLEFWRKGLCRKVSLHFEKEVELANILTYKYTLASDMYDRKPKNETDCYRGIYGELQDGLTDVSKCYFNMPFAASLPHFYGRPKGFTKKFEGLHPNPENHSCFTIVEPTMGVPLVQAARSQVNLVIPKFSSLFEWDYQMFSDMILPMFWIEYFQKDLTPDMMSMLGFFVNVLPIIEVALTGALLFVGFALIVSAFVKFVQSKRNCLAKTTKFVERSTGMF